MDTSQLALNLLGSPITCEEESVIVAADVSFEAQQLHDRSRFCWAVVGSPSGAIASVARGGPLLMRLREDEAARLAATLTEAAARALIEH